MFHAVMFSPSNLTYDHAWIHVEIDLQSTQYVCMYDDGTFTCHFGVTYVDLHLMGMYVCIEIT